MGRGQALWSSLNIGGPGIDSTFGGGVILLAILGCRRMEEVESCLWKRKNVHWITLKNFSHIKSLGGILFVNTIYYKQP